MNIKDLAVVFGIFLIVFYAGNSIMLGIMGTEQEVPSEIYGAWEASQEQITNARSIVTQNYEKIVSGDLIDKISGSFGVAFGGIFYIIVALWSVLISIPSQISSAVSYIAYQFGIPSQIILIITSLIVVVITIRVIEFITGRVL